jgi:hypothetical protein
MLLQGPFASSPKFLYRGNIEQFHIIAVSRTLSMLLIPPPAGNHADADLQNDV